MDFYKCLAQGQDTLQRITSQPRPVTSSGDRKFDDLFGSTYLIIIFAFSLFFIQIHRQKRLLLLRSIRIKIKKQLGKLTKFLVKRSIIPPI
jgi:hypothetical protein